MKFANEIFEPTISISILIIIFIGFTLFIINIIQLFTLLKNFKHKTKLKKLKKFKIKKHKGRVFEHTDDMYKSIGLEDGKAPSARDKITDAVSIYKNKTFKNSEIIETLYHLAKYDDDVFITLVMDFYQIVLREHLLNNMKIPENTEAMIKEILKEQIINMQDSEQDLSEQDLCDTCNKKNECPHSSSKSSGNPKNKTPNCMKH